MAETCAKSEPSFETSPKYGLNLTVPCCFWCQQPKNAPIPIGRIKTPDDDDQKAPPTVILDYEPCPACEAKMRTGIALLGCVDKPPKDGRPELFEGSKAWPTGRYIVLTEDDIKQILTGPIPKETIDAIIEKKIAMVPDDLVKQLIDAVTEQSGKPKTGPADL